MGSQYKQPYGLPIRGSTPSISIRPPGRFSKAGYRLACQISGVTTEATLQELALMYPNPPYSHSSPSALAIPIRQCRDHHIDAWAGRVSDAEATPKMKKP